MLPTCLQYGRSYPCIKANLTHGVVSEFIHILNMQLLFFYGQASQNEVTHGRWTLICTRQSWDSDNQNVAEQLRRWAVAWRCRNWKISSSIDDRPEQTLSRPKQGWFLPHSSIEPAQSTPTGDHHTILMKTPPRHIFERHWYNQQFRMLQMFAAMCNVVQWPSQQRPCCRTFSYSSHGACQLAAPTKFQIKVSLAKTSFPDPAVLHCYSALRKWWLHKLFKGITD